VGARRYLDNDAVEQWRIRASPNYKPYKYEGWAVAESVDNESSDFAHERAFSFSLCFAFPSSIDTLRSLLRSVRSFRR
jgi:hypothetical protein